jgi:hypothetical protein
MLQHLLNLKDYTPTELCLFVGGCFLWVGVYAIYIRNILKYQFVEVPLLGGCANIGWEFVWGLLFKTDMGPLMQWCYRAWFFLDVFIFWSVLRYGKEQLRIPSLQRYFVPLMLFMAGAWAVGLRAMVNSGLDTSIGATSAYLVNVLLSGSYLVAMLGQTTVKHYSLPVAWLKMLGTGMNTVFMNIHPAYSANSFLHFLSILSTVLDCVYIYALTQRVRAESTSTEAEVRPAVA